MEETKQNNATDVMPTIKKRDPRAEAIIESLNNGSSIIAACKGAGIQPVTFWRWRKADPSLEDEAAVAVTSRVMIVEDALYNSAIKGNITAQMFFLMNRAPENWKDKRAVPTVGVGVRVDNNARPTLPDDELRKVTALADRLRAGAGQNSPS